ncbi:hypothetical protein [Anaerostipes sp.]|uniref:hypothetical protein n=1 Tax=Anaerostipes sp. TaxID=1872530 RepID=UPI00267585B3|nr:hypothetical protein [uncultured Anaerostipes sp.]
MGIVKRTLNKVDPRLVEHGERAAYIALRILEEAEGGIPDDMLKNVLLRSSGLIWKCWNLLCSAPIIRRLLRMKNTVWHIPII